MFTGKSTTVRLTKPKAKRKVPNVVSLMSSGAVSQIEIRGQPRKTEAPKQHGISEQGMTFVDGYSTLLSYMQHTNITCIKFNHSLDKSVQNFTQFDSNLILSAD